MSKYYELENRERNRLDRKEHPKKSTLRQQRDYGEISLRAKHMNGSYENLDIVI